MQSIITVGSGGTIIQIECQLSNGLPSIVIVGLGNKAVDEAKERTRSAFASTGITLPRKRITINLAPADIPKDSTSLDLAIALAIMTASGQTSILPDASQAAIGEIGLDGTVRSVRGIIGKLAAGKKLGVTNFFVPEGNLEQALLVPDIRIMPIKTIKELTMQPGSQAVYPTHQSGSAVPQTTPTYTHTLSAVIGQPQAKRALEIAAAGGHNLLFSGPPGTGKSMLAKALPSLLPPLSHQEMLEVTHLHSLSSNNYEDLTTTRPFRAPHHSSSYVSIVGGGSSTRPGEITLSHHGVLFLDEMPEFSRATLEALRQPLEDKLVVVSRAKQTVVYPANFILVGTANPCPCGYYGTPKPCQCTPHQIHRYQQKVSGPILDRIDLHITVDTVQHEKLLSSPMPHSYDEEIRRRVTAARALQQKRYGHQETLNADMTNQEIKQRSLLSPEATSLLNRAAEQLDISARSYMRLIKVARTIADLEKSPTTQIPHISEALQYRPAHSKA